MSPHTKDSCEIPTLKPSTLHSRAASRPTFYSLLHC